ncbi:MAG: hypothetical protein Q9187_004622 [Circinaria calcarea]
MFMYHITSSNASSDSTVNSVDQSRETPARFVILAGVAIAFAIVIILISSATIFYLYTERHRYGKESMHPLREAGGHEPIGSMPWDGSDQYSAFDYHGDSTWPSAETTTNTFPTPATNDDTLSYGPPTEIATGTLDIDSQRYDSDILAYLQLFPKPGASVGAAPESWEVDAIGSGIGSPNSSSGGYLLSTASGPAHRVPQIYPGSLNSETESSSYQSRIATESPQIVYSRLDLDKPLPLEPGQGYPKPRILQKSQGYSSNGRRPPIPDLTLDSSFFGLTGRSHVEEAYSGKQQPSLSELPPTSAVSAFTSPQPFSPPFQFGITQNEPSSFSQSHPPRPVHITTAAKNYPVGSQRYITHRTSSSASRSPFPLGLPDVNLSSILTHQNLPY